MKRSVLAVATVAMMVAGAGLGTAWAGPLGSIVKGATDTVKDTVESVTDTVSDTVETVTGSTSSNSNSGGGGLNVLNVVTVNDDDNQGLVNVDLLNGNNQIVNAAVGKGSNPLLNANVSSSGLLSNTSVSIDLGGLGLDLNIDVGVPGPGGPQVGPDGIVLVGSLGGGGGNFVITCAVNNAKTLLQVAANGKITANEIKAWRKMANVKVVPIRLCPAAKKQVAAILGKSQKINLLRRAVMQDNLIVASLQRTSYDAGDVVAVQRAQGQLVVYVY